MTTETAASGAAAPTETAAAGGAAASSSGGAGAAAPAAGATPAAAAAKAGETASAASAAGEGGKAGAAAGAKGGGFLDDDVGGSEGAGAVGEVDATRMEAFSKAEGADARKEAWEKLNDAEKAKAAEGMSDADKEALGLKKADGTYTDFKMPEGASIDAPLMDKAKPLFAKHGLSQEAAQEFVDFYGAEVGAKLKEVGEAPYNLWRDTQNQWIDAVHADEELGGAKNQAARANAAKAINTLCSPEEAKAVRAALTFTGATNNPEIFRLISRMGARISEGRYVGGNPPTPAPKQPHEVMYGTTVKAAE